MESVVLLGMVILIIGCVIWAEIGYSVKKKRRELENKIGALGQDICRLDHNISVMRNRIMDSQRQINALADIGGYEWAEATTSEGFIKKTEEAKANGVNLS